MPPYTPVVASAGGVSAARGAFSLRFDTGDVTIPQVSRKHADTIDTARIVRALDDIERLGQCTDMDEVARQLIPLLVDQLSCDRATLYLFDPSPTIWAPAYLWSKAGLNLGEVPHTLPIIQSAAIESSAIGAILSGKPVCFSRDHDGTNICDSSSILVPLRPSFSFFFLSFFLSLSLYMFHSSECITLVWCPSVFEK
jgi:hypothetical protein